ncbi:hypothetical protein ZWY2020_028749 [Hordeum vulgare]|nr:hypothetical protein ZWY2020_028749 [Hordeum vulgare]
MALRCAVQLQIPTTIHRLGGVASLADLMAALSPSIPLVLHFWSDEDCVKILTQCKKAIPPHDEEER